MSTEIRPDAGEAPTLAPRPDTRFQPGRSGNPGGRPKIPDEVKEALRLAAPDAFQKLIALTNSRNERIRLDAIQALLDRAWGKPQQGVSIAGPDGEGPIQLAALVVLPAPTDE